ncbi:hypothetical protein COU80_04335 [Candidatus Peregrinibacteria bacterium CG10_big_fil_rev_8_21_14_0_10_55_24]|nr:MAG: hypothetical protein COU80_04335 [Candidatus Peregrinibacteria bacterium CG10_big_fil_rev_8_21_14_0_10_55_24]
MPSANQESAAQTTLQERTVRVDSAGYTLVDNVEDIIARIQAALAQPGSKLDPDGEFSLEIKPCALRFVDAEGAVLHREQVVTRLKVRMIMDEGVVLDVPFVGARVGKLRIELPPLPRAPQDPLPFNASETVEMHASPEAVTAVHRTATTPPPLPKTTTGDAAGAISESAADLAARVLQRFMPEGAHRKAWGEEDTKPSDEENRQLFTLLQTQAQSERAAGNPGFAVRLLAALAKEDPSPADPTTAFGALRIVLTGQYDESDKLPLARSALEYLRSLSFGGSTVAGPTSAVDACKKWAAKLIEEAKEQLGGVGGGGVALNIQRIMQRLDPANTNVSPDQRKDAIRLLARSHIPDRELSAACVQGGKPDEQRIGLLLQTFQRAATNPVFANMEEGDRTQLLEKQQRMARLAAQRTGKLNAAYGVVSVDPSVAARRAKLHGGKKS